MKANLTTKRWASAFARWNGAAALHRFPPGLGNLLVRLSSAAEAHPARFFVGFVFASMLAYVPLALLFTPSAWFQLGPFA